MAARRELGETLRRFGLSLPGAFEDHPWGELVLKAKKKVFVFLGRPGDVLSFSVKLPESGEGLLDQDWAEPTGYGLGKSGWVTLTVDGANPLGDADLCALIEESYRAVAPKGLVKELDARGAPGSRATAASPSPSRTRARSGHGQRDARSKKTKEKKEKQEKSRAGARRSRKRRSGAR